MTIDEMTTLIKERHMGKVGNNSRKQELVVTYKHNVLFSVERYKEAKGFNQTY